MTDPREKLIKTCIKAMQYKNCTDTIYKERLKKELQEIDCQAEHEYFLDLHKNKTKFSKNENNLFIAYVLDICDDFDIKKDPTYIQGEFPDIDVDYLPIIQDYLRNDFCPRMFGRDKVVNIGNYGTFGMKSALLDMTRVHGIDRAEIQSITKNLQDKDEEGNPLTWEKALEISPELNEYSLKYPEVTDAARRLIDRNRNRGKHAGGTVISSVKIDDFVPLMIDNDGNPVSGWTEGLHDQDLQPVGLIKFDVLAIKDLLRISNCCKLIKERNPEIKSISAMEDCSDWTDINYLNDSKAISLANDAKTRGVFQFDGEGMRNLVKSGGVDSFEDLVAYTALFRPGPLNMGMHERYIERKKGKESWEDEIPECLAEVLGKTYGVLCYQEQVMQTLNIVGDIPLIHCEKIRKAISKKKEKEFLKYKQMFLDKGSEKTGWPIDSDDNKNMNLLWSQLESFASYGFNKSMHQDTYILTPNGLKKIRNFQKGDKVYCVDESGNKVETEVVNLHDHGILECYSVVFDDGHEVICTLDHKFLTQEGQIPLHEILAKEISVFCEKEQGDNYAKKKGKWLDFEVWELFSHKKNKEQASKIMSELPEFILQDRRMEISLQEDFLSEVLAKKTSAEMPRMSKLRLGGQDLDISLPCEFSNMEEDEQSSQNMPGMQKYKTKECKDSKFKNKSVRGASQIIFYCSEKDFCAARDSGSESRKSKKMERKKSRKICKMHRGSKQKPKAIKNGKLVANRIELENKKNSLRKKNRTKVETSGYGERQNLDRSRWILSFFRTSKQQDIRGLYAPCGPAERQNVKRRMFEKKVYRLNKNRNVLFPNQHRKNENRMVDIVSEHAPISETRNLVSRKIVRAMPVGKQHCYDLEVACSTHNFILPNGTVTSNSHAVAYTYISSRLLYLKAHFPLEFFVTTLSLEADEDKLKSYKREAERLGITINRCNLNKSKSNYSIVDDQIYIGFSNIKGIGKEVAQEIVDKQPYKGIEDFLLRSGTDKRIVEPLIFLEVFSEKPINILLEFYEEFKKWDKSNLSKSKAQEKRRNSLIENMKSLFKDENNEILNHNALMILYENFDEFDESVLCEEFSKDDFHQVLRKYWKSVSSYEQKADLLSQNFISLENWEPKNIHPIEQIPNQFEIEKKCYGFSWQHPIEKSPDYAGDLSFGRFKDDEFTYNAGVECMVTKKPEEKVSKKGNKYYFVLVEDEDWNVEVVTFWEEDYNRFKEELKYWNEEEKRGNLLKIRVTRPGKGFKSYTFESPKKQDRVRLPPKEKDFRFYIMRPPVKRGKND